MSTFFRVISYQEVTLSNFFAVKKYFASSENNQHGESVKPEGYVKQHPVLYIYITILWRRIGGMEV
jgi:hypothetical protein